LETWFEIVRPTNPVTLPRLDAGESEAIALAIQINADVLLIDDHAGRQAAAGPGLRVAGTLSVLDDADRGGLLRFDEACDRLRQTSFYVSAAVIKEIMRRRSPK